MTKSFSFIFLVPGDKVLVVHRRLYDGDKDRFFTGVVDGFEAGLVKVTGHSWSFSAKSREPQQKPEARTKILSIHTGALIFYQLPSEANLASFKFSRDHENKLVLSDGHAFKMDLSEG